MCRLFKMSATRIARFHNNKIYINNLFTLYFIEFYLVRVPPYYIYCDGDAKFLSEFKLLTNRNNNERHKIIHKSSRTKL